MRAISIRQPWAYAILYRGKQIENRKWNTHYRGPVLLHVGAAFTTEEYAWALDWMEDRGLLQDRTDIPYRAYLKTGGIVGRAELIDVVKPVKFGPPKYPPAIDPRWHMTEQYGFVLTNVEALPFKPMKGALGLFDAVY